MRHVVAELPTRGDHAVHPDRRDVRVAARVGLALSQQECQPADAEPAIATRRRAMLDDRKLDVLRAIVEDYVSTQEPVGSKALVERHQPRRLPGHRAQRHGRAGGGGLHHPAAHQRRPDPHRQGLPAVRRQAGQRQAALRRREAGHRDVPAGRRRPRRRRAPQRPAARPAHPAGRDRAVPDAGPLHRAARRGRHAVAARGCCWC